MRDRLKNRATPVLRALLALFALLTQSIVSSLPMPAATGITVAGTAAGALCLNGGDHAAQQKKDHGTGHKSVPCPICLAVHLMGSLLTPKPLSIAYPRSIGPPFAAHDLQELYRLAATTNQARGPPPSF